MSTNKSIISILFHSIYGAPPIQLILFLMMVVRICVLDLILIIIKLGEWPICHCSGLGLEIMVSAVCLSKYGCDGEGGGWVGGTCHKALHCLPTGNAIPWFSFQAI